MYASLHVRILVKSAGHQTVSGWPLTSPAGHQPNVIIYRHRAAPVWYVPRKRKFLKIDWCPCIYHIRRWRTNHWNCMMSVSFVTIAAIKTVIHCLKQWLIKPVSITVCQNASTTFNSRAPHKKKIPRIITSLMSLQYLKTKCCCQNWYEISSFFLNLWNKFKTTCSE